MAVAVKGTDETPPRRSFFHSPEFYGRILLMFCAVAVSAPLFYKSRPVGDFGPPAAFSVPASPSLYVKVSGAVRHPGVYQVSANKMTIDAIKMAECVTPDLDRLMKGIPATTLEDGMSLDIAVTQNGKPVLTVASMSVDERLVLGIQLDLNHISAADLDKVPGIGPALAERIVLYRHKNGGFMRVTDLMAVEGVGEKSFVRFKKYFK